MDPKRKAIVCDMDKPEEKELWEWLQTLPHGAFSEVTKRFWRSQMEFEREKKNPEEIWRNKMEDAVTRIEIPWLSELKKMKEDECK